MEKQYISSYGFKKIKNEIEAARLELEAALKQREEAASYGDAKENGELKIAKEKIKDIDNRIKFMQHAIQNVEVVNIEELSGDVVMFGSTVEIEYQDSKKKEIITIVGPNESDIDRGLFALNAPLVQALLGKSAKTMIKFEFNSKKI